MKHFIEVDPYNPENTIEGIIYNEENSKYGCIQIEKINGIACPQYIHATPKFDYPDKEKDGNLKFPTGWLKCTVYDKLDGTNILAWRYEFNGKNYTTFKTRLTPFLKDSGFSTWIKMWKICNDKHPEIQQIIADNPDYNICFEMYGSLNPIIISYKFELECSFIYGIHRKTGNIINPHDLTIHSSLCPLIYKRLYALEGLDIAKIYNDTKKQLEEQYQKDKSVEGAMFYFSFSEKDIVYKCKPPSVLDEFRKANSSITHLGYNNVHTTCINALENITKIEELQDETEKLLLEEFSPNMIVLNKNYITKIVEQVKDDLILRQRVNEFYLMSGLKFPEQRPEVMRYLMQHFSKEKSTKVYHAMCYLTL